MIQIMLFLFTVLWVPWSALKFALSARSGTVWIVRNAAVINDGLKKIPLNQRCPNKLLKELGQPRSLPEFVRPLPYVGRLLWLAQVYYILPVINSALLVLHTSARSPQWVIVLLVLLTVGGVVYEVTQQYARRLYVPRIADLDPSTRPGSGLPRLVRPVQLFVFDCAMLVLSFAAVHFAVHSYCSTTEHPAYHGITTAGLIPQFMSFVYYTVVTFSTVGFGDIYPLVAVSQIATTVQIAIGFLYVVAFVILLSLTMRPELVPAGINDDSSDSSDPGK